MTQVVFASRADRVRSLHGRVDATSTAIEVVESEIRQTQHEQALRSDRSQTLRNGFPHPHSKAGRDGIRACRERLKELKARRSKLVKQRSTLRDEIRHEENILAGNSWRPRTREPMRKL